MSWLTLALVVPTALAVPVALAQCPTQRPTPTQVVVTITGGDAADHAAAAAVVEAALATPELSSGGLRASTCARGGAVVLSTSAPAVSAVAHARAALQAPQAAQKLGSVTVEIAARSEVIADFAVRGPDPFSTRDAVDSVLLPALRSIAGADAFEVHGGRRERRVALDAERLLAADVALPEVLDALRTASSLEQAVVKTSPLVRLTDVADLGLAPAGETLRRDGALEVVVRGHRRARRSMIDAARRVTLPAGVTLVALDDASDEQIAVRVRGAADVDELRRALLSIPGARPVAPAAALHLALDKSGARARGLSPEVAGRLVRAADDGIVVAAAGGPVRVVLAAATTPEALLSVVVARQGAAVDGDGGAGPVRLFDVARGATGVLERLDRLDRQSATRVRLRFDAGARKAALADVDAAIADWSSRHPQAFAVVERAHDVPVFDDVCP
jgi:hypothetical protein